MSDGFEQYKSLQKQIEELDRRSVAQATEVARLRSLAQTTRDNLEQLTTAVLGSDLLGMRGLLDRLESLESKLTKIWMAFLVALVLGALLNITTLFLLVRLIDKL